MKVVRIRLSFVTEPLSKYTTPPSQLTTKFVVDLIRTERYIKVYTFTLRSCNSSAYIRRITENCKMVFAESGVCTKLSSWQCSTESGFELCFFLLSKENAKCAASATAKYDTRGSQSPSYKSKRSAMTAWNSDWRAIWHLHSSDRAVFSNLHGQNAILTNLFRVTIHRRENNDLSCPTNISMIMGSNGIGVFFFNISSLFT